MDTGERAPTTRSRWFWVGWGRVYQYPGCELWIRVKEPLQRDRSPLYRNFNRR
ncbi:MAG: hypothetical protein ACRCT1_06460 [Microcoleaceae cyanobacterium]